MISEPELTGGFDAPLAGLPPAGHGSLRPAYGTAAGSDAPPRVPAQGGPPGGEVVAGAGPGPAARLRARLPRHWRWALGGAAAASAAWIAGVVVWDPTEPVRPDLHGYHLVADPCVGSALRPLFDAAHSPSFTSGVVDVVRSPALDAQDCAAHSSAPDSATPTAAYTAYLTVELHKTTDPRPEFESEHTLPHDTLAAARSVEPVAGLGDEAYLLHQDATLIGLEVLHGGAVVRLEVSAVPIVAGSLGHADGSPRPAMPRIDTFRPAMIAAVRAVMTDMRADPHPAKPAG